jgi:hypothetical protein
MKKLITISAICIITSILFASCKQNLSVTKRHYNNGYYIAHSKGKQAVQPAKTIQAATPEKPTKVSYSIQNTNQQNDLIGITESNSVTFNQVVAKNTAARVKVEVTKTGTSKISHSISSIRPFVTPISNIKAASKKVLVVADDRGGLSLFWIIILVILILWAFGFLGGYIFGGLINLLLLIALILLVLWLLRII